MSRRQQGCEGSPLLRAAQGSAGLVRPLRRRVQGLRPAHVAGAKNGMLTGPNHATDHRTQVSFRIVRDCVELSPRVVTLLLSDLVPSSIGRLWKSCL